MSASSRLNEEYDLTRTKIGFFEPSSLPVVPAQTSDATPVSPPSNQQ